MSRSGTRLLGIKLIMSSPETTKRRGGIRNAEVSLNLRMRVDDDPPQRAVLGPYDACAVLVRRERGRAANEPRVQRGALRSHPAHGAGARARTARAACARHASRRAPPRAHRPTRQLIPTHPSPVLAATVQSFTFTHSTLKAFMIFIV